MSDGSLDIMSARKFYQETHSQGETNITPHFFRGWGYKNKQNKETDNC